MAFDANTGSVVDAFPVITASVAFVAFNVATEG